MCQGEVQPEVPLVAFWCQSNVRWHVCRRWHYSGSEGADIRAGGGVGGGVCRMCFTSSVSHQPQQTGPLSGQPFTGARQQTQHFAKFSSLCPPSSFSVFLPACIFIASPHSPHAITYFSLLFPPFFLVHFFTFTGSSPAFGPSLPVLPASFPLSSPMVL